MLFGNKENDQQLIAVSNFTELITRYYQASCLVVFAYQKAVHRGSEEGFIQVLLCLLQLDLGKSYFYGYDNKRIYEMA